MTSPQKPGGTVGGSWSFGSAAGVVTATDRSSPTDGVHAERVRPVVLVKIRDRIVYGEKGVTGVG
jgi:hypothetical protein